MDRRDMDIHSRNSKHSINRIRLQSVWVSASVWRWVSVWRLVWVSGVVSMSVWELVFGWRLVWLSEVVSVSGLYGFLNRRGCRRTLRSMRGPPPQPQSPLNPLSRFLLTRRPRVRRCPYRLLVAPHRFRCLHRCKADQNFDRSTLEQHLKWW